MSLKERIDANRGGDDAKADAKIKATTEAPENDEDETEDGKSKTGTKKHDGKAKPKEDAKSDGGKVAASTEEKPAASAAADPADVAAYCADNDCAHMAAGLIREKATMEQVKARVGAADAIRKIVADAGKVNPTIKAELAEEMIKADMSVEQARAEVFDKLTARQSKEARGSIASDTGSGADAGSNGWDTAYAKANPGKAA